MKGYIVLPRGGLWKFSLEYAPTTDPANLPERCTHPMKISLSHCVDIDSTDTNSAGNFWIGWSNIAWTQDMIRKIHDASWRQTHMQCIDIKDMVEGSAAHTGKFTDCSGTIPHFNVPEKTLEKAFAFSNTPIEAEATLRSWRTRIDKSMRRVNPIGGFVIAVNDPVGITNDLSELTSPSAYSGFDEEMHRGRICAELIASVEVSVRKKALKHEELLMAMEKSSGNSEDDAAISGANTFWSVLKAGGFDRYAAQRRAGKNQYGDSPAGRLAAAEDRAWYDLSHDGKGNSVLDEVRLKNFPAQYAEAVRLYEPMGVALAVAHCKWLKSEQLSSWMQGIHDPNDIRSGFAYRESLAQCIGKAVSTPQCEQVLIQWLSSGDVLDVNNLYTRALLFNHHEIASAARPHIHGSDIKAKYLLSVYKGALGRFTKGEEAKLVDRLALTTANILARALAQASVIAMRNIALIGLTLLGKVIITPSGLSRDDLGKWLISAAKKKGIEFDEDRTTVRTSARREARRVLPKYPAGPATCAFEMDVSQLEAEGRISAGALKMIKIPGYNLSKQWFSKAEFNIGAVGVVLQIAALYFATDNLKRSDEFDRNKNAAKVAVAAVSLSAGLVEMVATVLERAPNHPMSRFIFSHWNLSGSDIAKTIRYAKMAGAVAGILSAAFDMVNCAAAISNDDGPMVILYASNAVLGVSLAVAGYYCGAAVYWPLFVVAFTLGLVIAILKDPALKIWIQRCYFSSGTDRAKLYSSSKSELSAFNLAIEG